MNFDKIDDGVMERAKKILPILELTNFAWDINTVLAQPEDELAAVFALKSVGNKIQMQARLRKTGQNG